MVPNRNTNSSYQARPGRKGLGWRAPASNSWMVKVGPLTELTQGGGAAPFPCGTSPEHWDLWERRIWGGRLLSKSYP